MNVQDDGSVEQTGVPSDRLEGDLARNVGGLAALEEAVVFSDGLELCKVGGTGSQARLCVSLEEASKGAAEDVPGRYRPACLMTQAGARSVSSPDVRKRAQSTSRCQRLKRQPRVVSSADGRRRRFGRERNEVRTPGSPQEQVVLELWEACLDLVRCRHR